MVDHVKCAISHIPSPFSCNPTITTKNFIAKMLSFLTRKKGFKYTSLVGDISHAGSKSTILYRFLLLLLLLGSLLSFTYFLGKHSTLNWSKETLSSTPTILLLPNSMLTTSSIKSSRHTFEGSDFFIGRPTIQKKLAWQSLFPASGGFFTYPELVPKRSVFSAFHQLHCLVSSWIQATDDYY